jgi:hypothetical protein
VDQNDLLSAGPEVALNGAAPAAGKVLDDNDVAALFGLEMAETAGFDAAAPVAVATPGRRGRSPGAKASAGRGGNGAGRPAKIEAPAADAAKAPRSAHTKGKAPERGRPARPLSPKNNAVNGVPVAATAAPQGRAKKSSHKGVSAKAVGKATARKGPTRGTRIAAG